MDQALFSPYVMLAAATVGKVISKKAVDTLARSSLNGISIALNRRFQGDNEVCIWLLDCLSNLPIPPAAHAQSASAVTATATDSPATQDSRHAGASTED